jgi:hypothetical protein
MYCQRLLSVFTGAREAYSLLKKYYFYFILSTHFLTKLNDTDDSVLIMLEKVILMNRNTFNPF